MREPLDMVIASRMQNMVEIRKKNICFVSILSYSVRPVLIVSCPILIRTVPVSSRMTRILSGDAHELFRLKCDDCGCYPRSSRYLVFWACLGEKAWFFGLAWAKRSSKGCLFENYENWKWFQNPTVYVLYLSYPPWISHGCPVQVWRLRVLPTPFKEYR